ncbi:hypothetical protein SJAG_00006 [Schizosaccharomyces japonicus yFS275]|uniref:Uncharacterized protein n=1 Tax=Schizosaccharomyces japonicus (strain yFS275 / FY16936) TaxID=402676 RepID=B6JUR7_SCHJY|nr:hypothetical protein SJAG_00006 [Schizosaccharomyces japonicus yFS275]EEB05021.2 hypothetical protein SJAG_00006 [Schizosaccharomyces japonicus yFS275]
MQSYEVGCLTRVVTAYKLLPEEGLRDSSLRLLQTFYPIGISSSDFGMFLYCHECEILLQEMDVINHFLSHKPKDVGSSILIPEDYEPPENEYESQLEYLLDPIREDLVLTRKQILNLFEPVSRFPTRSLLPGIQTTNHVLECCKCLFYDSKEFKKHVQLHHQERDPPKKFVIVQKLKVSSTDANDDETKTLIFPATDDCNYIIE